MGLWLPAVIIGHLHAFLLLSREARRNLMEHHTDLETVSSAWKAEMLAFTPMVHMRQSRDYSFNFHLKPYADLR